LQAAAKLRSCCCRASTRLASSSSSCNSPLQGTTLLLLLLLLLLLPLLAVEKLPVVAQMKHKVGVRMMSPSRLTSLACGHVHSK